MHYEGKKFFDHENKRKSLVFFSHLYNAQNERGALEVVLEAEVDLADVLGGLRVVDVHVHQRDGSALQEGLLR